MTIKHQITSVFFDLDGTLIDTAPDMANALNLQLIAHGKPVISSKLIRPWVSHGVAALLKLAFNLTPKDSNFEKYRIEYLDIYARNLAIESKLFDHLDTFLAQLENNNIKWGVVTNKPEFLAVPLLKQLKLYSRACAIVCGDTIKPTKPSPIPIFLACKLSKQVANQAIYVGDALRDIQAGKSAGMLTVAAKYGYIDNTDDVETWKADLIIEHPQELLSLINI